MKTLPFCSIVILNYFGEKVILQTIQSLFSMSYPRDRYEIIVVDNNSQDKSAEVLRQVAKKNKNIKVIYSKKNSGFAAGNNSGIRIAKGKYIALLNNDCFVDKNWLVEMVKTAEADKNIGIVGGKILLYPSFFSLVLENTQNQTIQNAYLTTSSLLRLSHHNHIPVHYHENEQKIVLNIPFEENHIGIIECEFIFKKQKKLFTRSSVLKCVNFSNSSLHLLDIQEDEKIISYKYRIDLRQFNLKSLSYRKIQNAGIFVFPDGAGRDIGSMVAYQTQDYENDIGQYEKSREIYAACGAAVLFRKDALQKVGYLNESFFMYYEDVDLSERLRFNGYTIRYAPRAVTRHLHAYSSGEWSPFFVYQVERGRLLHVLLNFPFYVFLREYIIFTMKSIFRCIIQVIQIRKYRMNIQYLKIVVSFLFLTPYTFFKNRHYYRRVRKKRYENYISILNGKWYFN